jgi:hypothetical protein
VNHSLDSMVYAFGPLLGEWAERHQHLLVKDPRRLGWKCEVPGCGFFKPAEEFDGIRLVPGLEWWDEA